MKIKLYVGLLLKYNLPIVLFCFNSFQPRTSTDAADSTTDPVNDEEIEDEHQYLGINRAAVSRSQAHTLPFIQSDYHWRCSLTGALKYFIWLFVNISVDGYEVFAHQS